MVLEVEVPLHRGPDHREQRDPDEQPDPEQGVSFLVQIGIEIFSKGLGERRHHHGTGEDNQNRNRVYYSGNNVHLPVKGEPSSVMRLGEIISILLLLG